MVVPVLTWFIIYIFAAPVVEKAEGEDSKLFLWFATRQELGWGWLGRRERSRFEKISEFHFSREKQELEALQSYNLDESIFCFLIMPEAYLAHFSLLIFGPKFVVQGAINRGWGSGLLARFILNITICWLFLHLHFYCAYIQIIRTAEGKNRGRSNWEETFQQSRVTRIWSKIIPLLYKMPTQTYLFSSACRLKCIFDIVMV